MPGPSPYFQNLIKLNFFKIENPYIAQGKDLGEPTLIEDHWFTFSITSKPILPCLVERVVKSVKHMLPNIDITTHHSTIQLQFRYGYAKQAPIPFGPPTSRTSSQNEGRPLSFRFISETNSKLRGNV